MAFPVPPPVVLTGQTGVVVLNTMRAAELSFSFIGTNFGDSITLGYIDSTKNFQPLTKDSVLTETCSVNVRAGHSRQLALSIVGTPTDAMVEMYIIAL